jgi:ABC-type sugar transport system substrate-binding protein
MLRLSGSRLPDVVGCQNDDMALAAREALHEAARELSEPALRDVPVTGVDGLADAGRAWVEQGKLAATVVVPSTGTRAVELLLGAWKSGRPMPLKSIEAPLSFPGFDVLRPARARASESSTPSLQAA